MRLHHPGRRRSRSCRLRSAGRIRPARHAHRAPRSCGQKDHGGRQRPLQPVQRKYGCILLRKGCAVCLSGLCNDPAQRGIGLLCFTWPDDRQRRRTDLSAHDDGFFCIGCAAYRMRTGEREAADRTGSHVPYAKPPGWMVRSAVGGRRRLRACGHLCHGRLCQPASGHGRRRRSPSKIAWTQRRRAISFVGSAQVRSRRAAQPQRHSPAGGAVA